VSFKVALMKRIIMRDLLRSILGNQASSQSLDPAITAVLQVLNQETIPYKYIPRKLGSAYDGLDIIVSNIKDDQPVRNIFNRILAEAWPVEYYMNLNLLDSYFVKNKVAQSITAINEIHPNDDNYALLTTAVFALKYYIERARLNHPFPSMKSSLEIAKEKFNVLKNSAPSHPSCASTLGKEAADYFMEEERVKCKKGGRKSLYDAIKLPLFMGIIISRLRRTTIDNNSFIVSLFLDYVPIEFKPKFIKNMVDEIQKKYGVIITRYFNPTGGWGGRLIGAMATSSIDYYMETDPNTNLQLKKLEMIQTYYEGNDKELLPMPSSSSAASSPATMGVRLGPKQYILLQQPVEDLTESFLRPEGRPFQLVLYSPPYFDLEKYPNTTANQTQSYIRYPTFDRWKVEFLYKSIEQSYIALCNGGMFAINVCQLKMLDLTKCVTDYMEQHSNRFISVATYAYSPATKYKSNVYLYKKMSQLDLTLLNTNHILARGLLQSPQVGDPQTNHQDNSNSITGTGQVPLGLRKRKYGFFSGKENYSAAIIASNLSLTVGGV
jgi:hypothetical protein